MTILYWLINWCFYDTFYDVFMIDLISVIINIELWLLWQEKIGNPLNKNKIKHLEGVYSRTKITINYRKRTKLKNSTNNNWNGKWKKNNNGKIGRSSFWEDKIKNSKEKSTKLIENNSNKKPNLINLWKKNKNNLLIQYTITMDHQTKI